MASIGSIFREAREAKKVTASQAASATRMKIQTIEALERDDFSRMAAPMYAKGFIKLYSEYLDVDPAPLIQEYMDRYAPRERPKLMTPDEAKEAAGIPVPKKPLIVIPWEKIRAWILRIWKPVAGAVAVIVGILLALAALGRCSKVETKPEESTPAPKTEKRLILPVVREPSEPYLEGTTPSTPKP